MSHVLQIKLKRLGKKKIKTAAFDIRELPTTVKELIEQCVYSEVERYNVKRDELQLIGFLTPREIQDQSQKGKIGIGDIYNTQRAHTDHAVEVAKEAFNDGLFVVFIDNEEAPTLEHAIDMTQQPEITFIRMTFLSGR